MSAAFEIEAKMVAALLTQAALEALDWIDCEPEDFVQEDLAALRSGEQTLDGLLDECLDGADAETEQGWRDYVDALRSHLVAVPS